MGIAKTPSYTTVLSDDVPLVMPNPVKLQGELLASLRNSSFLESVRGVVLAVDGSTVFLKGQVPTEQMRTRVENLVRLTPGVRGVVNELVAPAPAIRQ